MPKKPEKMLPFRDSPSGARGFGGCLNLGPKSSAWLDEIGLRSIDEVRRLGPIEVCRQLRRHGRPVSVLMAYALEGALSGCHWNALPWETRSALREEFARMKRTREAEPVPALSATSRRRPSQSAAPRPKNSPIKSR